MIAILGLDNRSISSIAMVLCEGGGFNAAVELYDLQAFTVVLEAVMTIESRYGQDSCQSLVSPIRLLPPRL